MQKYEAEFKVTRTLTFDVRPGPTNVGYAATLCVDGAPAGAWVYAKNDASLRVLWAFATHAFGKGWKPERVQQLLELTQDA